MVITSYPSKPNASRHLYLTNSDIAKCFEVSPSCRQPVRRSVLCGREDKIGDYVGNDAAKIALTGKELGDFDATTIEGKKALRKSAESHLNKIKGDWINCPALGGEVEIRKKGIKEYIARSADARKLQIVSIIDKIIQKGVKVGARKPYDDDIDTSAIMYYTLRTEVNLKDERIAVRTVIKEDVNGAFHYDATVHDVEVVFDSIAKSPELTGLFAATTSNDGVINNYTSHLASHQLELIKPQLDDSVNNTFDSAGNYEKKANKEAMAIINAIKKVLYATVERDGGYDAVEYSRLLDIVKSSTLYSKVNVVKAIGAIERSIFIKKETRDIDLISAFLTVGHSFYDGIYDAATGKMILNLFLQVKDPVTGELVDLPDDEPEIDVGATAKDMHEKDPNIATAFVGRQDTMEDEGLKQDREFLQSVVDGLANLTLAG